MGKSFRFGEVMIGKEVLQRRIHELGEQISEDYGDEPIVAVGILKGAAIFMTDLVREINADCRMDFIQVSSYGGSMESSGEITMVKDIDLDIEGKNVLVVEDIVDSGRTLCHLIEMLSKRNPKSLRTVVLLDKPTRRTAKFEPDYTGFTIEDRFIVGYGLDYNQMYRNLPYISYLEEVEDEK